MIRFHCDCGKRLKVPEEHAGRLAECPYCGKHVRVPAKSQAAPGGPDALRKALASPPPAPAAMPVAQPVAKAPKPKPAAAPRKPAAARKPAAKAKAARPKAKAKPQAAAQPGLAGLAQAAAETKAGRTGRVPPRTAPRGQSKTPGGTATEQILGRRHQAKANSTKVVLAGVGIAVVLLGGLIAIAFLMQPKPEPEPVDPPMVYQPQDTGPRSTPGELFPNVPAQD